MATMEGPLVLADISGYTKFLAETELEHSDVLVRRMLNTIVASLRGRLAMAQLEGDAVFFVGEGVPPELIEWLEDSYVTFPPADAKVPRAAPMLLRRLRQSARADAQAHRPLRPLLTPTDR